jgi:hypothetical protein
MKQNLQVMSANKMWAMLNEKITRTHHGPVLQVMFRLVSAYSLSHNTIESAETSRLFHQPNQPHIYLIGLLPHLDFPRVELDSGLMRSQEL